MKATELDEKRELLKAWVHQCALILVEALPRDFGFTLLIYDKSSRDPGVSMANNDDVDAAREVLLAAIHNIDTTPFETHDVRGN